MGIPLTRQGRQRAVGSIFINTILDNSKKE